MKKGLFLAFSLLAASFSASATTMTGTVIVFGNVPTITSPAGGSTSAAQFNNAAVSLSVIGACPSGFTCSGATLVSIDFTLTTNVNASVTVQNTTGSTTYISGIGSVTTNGTANTNPLAGTFATSGIAIQQKTTVTIVDPL
jgi:Fe-S cluster biogenesis protein NfuA